MDNLLSNYSLYLDEVRDKYELLDIKSIDHPFDEHVYWNRLSALRSVEHNLKAFGYFFLQEIEVMSSQIHFGVLNCIIFNDARSRGRHPNVYNHRCTFMFESTIHAIYSFWNRVALLLNFYLDTPIKKEGVYIVKVLNLLKIQKPALSVDDNFNWLESMIEDLSGFRRNEFAHNYSLLMQGFFFKKAGEEKVDLDELLKKLIKHNNSIVNDLDKLITLLETLENPLNTQD